MGRRKKTNGVLLNSLKEYKTWIGMKQRCYNTKNKRFEHYGGRGIKVCDRWLGKEGFNNFYEDMGVRPSNKHSIDRIDNNGDYEPRNCRWSTQTEQVNNRRNNRFLKYNGEIKTITQWENELGFKSHQLFRRINSGWEIDKAFTK